MDCQLVCKIVKNKYLQAIEGNCEVRRIKTSTVYQERDVTMSVHQLGDVLACEVTDSARPHDDNKDNVNLSSIVCLLQHTTQVRCEPLLR